VRRAAQEAEAMSPGSVALAGALLALPALAAVRGAVSNGTTGRPQSGVKITLYKLEGGMQPIGEATTGADGRFRLEAPPPPNDMPYLVQAHYQGVNYHGAARAGLPGTDSETAIEVFDSTSERTGIQVTSHQMILEPRPGRLLVAEIYHLRNDAQPRRTFTGARGSKDTFRFAVPLGDIQELTVASSGGSRLPLKREPAARGKGIYALEQAIEPGESRIEVNYRLPYESSLKLQRPDPRPLFAGPELSEVIAPLRGVTVAGPGLVFAKKEDSQGANYYTWNGKGAIELNGALPESAGEGGAAEAGGEQSLSTVVNPNYIHQARWKILIVLGMALALGLAHLYRARFPAGGGEAAKK
jgi:hypothetical protein